MSVIVISFDVLSETHGYFIIDNYYNKTCKNQCSYYSGFQRNTSCEVYKQCAKKCFAVNFITNFLERFCKSQYHLYRPTLIKWGVILLYIDIMASKLNIKKSLSVSWNYIIWWSCIFDFCVTWDIYDRCEEKNLAYNRLIPVFFCTSLN